MKALLAILFIAILHGHNHAKNFTGRACWQPRSGKRFKSVRRAEIPYLKEP